MTNETFEFCIIVQYEFFATYAQDNTQNEVMTNETLKPD